MYIMQGAEAASGGAEEAEAEAGGTRSPKRRIRNAGGKAEAT